MDVAQHAIYTVRLRGDPHHAGAIEHEGLTPSALGGDRRAVDRLHSPVGEGLVDLAKLLGPIKHEVGEAEQANPRAAVIVEAIDPVLYAEGALEVGVTGDDEVDGGADATGNVAKGLVALGDVKGTVLREPVLEGVAPPRARRPAGDPIAPPACQASPGCRW